MNGARVGFACALLGALGFSFKAILVKTAYRYGVPAETLLASRMLYSLPFFIAMAGYAQWRRPYRFTARDWRELAQLGFFGYYVSSFADFLGLQYVSAALERVLLYTFPTFVVIMTAIGKRERPTPMIVGALLLSYIGVALAVFHGGGAGTSNLPLGASRSSIVSTLGPIFTMLLAGARRGEKVTIYMWIGALCVILGVRLVAMSPAPARNTSD